MDTQRIREAVAAFLYGNGYTTANVKSIAIFDNGRWYKYPEHGDWRLEGRKVFITRDR